MTLTAAPLPRLVDRGTLSRLIQAAEAAATFHSGRIAGPAAARTSSAVGSGCIGLAISLKQHGWPSKRAARVPSAQRARPQSARPAAERPAPAGQASGAETERWRRRGPGSSSRIVPLAGRGATRPQSAAALVVPRPPASARGRPRSAVGAGSSGGSAARQLQARAMLSPRR